VNQLDTEDTDAGAWTAERHVTSLYQARALTRYAPPRVIGTNVNFFLPSVSW
jgi:hypothetical protein